MAAIKKVEINSKVEFEAYEYLWKLHNFGVAQETEAGIDQQRLEIRVGTSRSVQSKWLVGLRSAHASRTIAIYFKLLEKTGEESKIFTRVSVERGKTEDSLIFLEKVENATALDEEFMVNTGWVLKQPAETWSPYLDENGTFLIKLKVELLVSQVQQSQCRSFSLENLRKASLKRQHHNFSKLLENADSHDIKLVCSDGIEIGAHKLILMAQNTVFASMFESDLSENPTEVINVKKVTGKTMKIILHYLYTGELLDEWCQPDTIVEFTYAAGKYQLTDILDMLDNVLGNDDDDSTCNLVLLNLANKLSLETAEAKLMERIVRLTNAAKNSTELLEILNNDSNSEKSERERSRNSEIETARSFVSFGERNTVIVSTGEITSRHCTAEFEELEHIIPEFKETRETAILCGFTAEGTKKMRLRVVAFNL